MAHPNHRKHYISSSAIAIEVENTGTPQSRHQATLTGTQIGAKGSPKWPSKLSLLALRNNQCLYQHRSSAALSTSQAVGPPQRYLAL
jgi:hypothetical protein